MTDQRHRPPNGILDDEASRWLREHLPADPRATSAHDLVAIFEAIREQARLEVLADLGSRLSAAAGNHPLDDLEPALARRPATQRHERIVGAIGAAEALDVSRATIDRALAVPDDDLPEHARPLRWGTAKRVRAVWDSLEHLRAWWVEASRRRSLTPNLHEPGPAPCPVKRGREKRKVRLNEFVRDLKAGS